MSIVDDEVTNNSRGRGEGGGRRWRCFSIIITSINWVKPCCIWLPSNEPWTDVQMRMRMRMRKLTAIAHPLIVTGSVWPARLPVLFAGQQLSLVCLEGPYLPLCSPTFSTLPQRRVANPLKGTQNVIKCYADCALLSRCNNNRCFYRIIKCKPYCCIPWEF